MICLQQIVIGDGVGDGGYPIRVSIRVRVRVGMVLMPLGRVNLLGNDE